MLLKSRTFRIVLCVGVLGLALAGCGGLGGNDTPTATPAVVIVTATPEPTTVAQAPEATQAPTGASGSSKGAGAASAVDDEEDAPLVSGAVSTLQGVKSAVIQIEAQGSFRDPEFGYQANAAGRGTGFFVNDSGLAITNNHVATGAAFYKVWVAGESQPRNARLLGYSECSDLAVLQVDGDSPAYLEWYTGEVEPGLEIYVAGFPLGDPEYTLTRGIVSKQRAEGDTDWASVDSVIEHDARLNPGNSGGPLVTKDGQVVAVNFAYSSESGQSFSIGRSEVDKIFDALVEGDNVNSIGVNGRVVYDSDISGIWVASVQSGSPADEAGIKGGDLILELEGFVLGTDGTMADYCNVLRSHRSGDTLAVQVLRYDSGEVLEGQLNGRELEVTEVISADDYATDEESSYWTVRDDTDTLEVNVPASWGEVSSDIWYLDDGTMVGPRLVVAPDVDAYQNSYDAPGVLFLASSMLLDEYDAASFLDLFDAEIRDANACSTIDPRQTYSDPFYDGAIDTYAGCGSLNGNIAIVAATPEDGAYMVVVWVQYARGDEAALSTILESFWVPGTVD